MWPHQSTNETRLDRIKLLELKDNRKDLRDHGNPFVFRVKLDFSNVHIYHADGYIPRNSSIFNLSSVKEALGTYCCEGQYSWPDVAKVDDDTGTSEWNFSDESLRRKYDGRVLTLMPQPPRSSEPSAWCWYSYWLIRRAYGQAAINLTHPQDLYKPPCRVRVRKDWIYDALLSLMTHIRLGHFLSWCTDGPFHGNIQEPKLEISRWEAGGC